MRPGALPPGAGGSVPFATAMLLACLKGLGWLLWVVALLILILAIARTLRGEPVQHGELALAALACLAGGYAARRLAFWMQARLR